MPAPTMQQAMAIHQPAADSDDATDGHGDQPGADTLEDNVGPDDFDVFDVLGLGDAVKSNNADGSSDQDSSVGSDA